MNYERRKGKDMDEKGDFGGIKRGDRERPISNHKLNLAIASVGKFTR